MSSSIPPLPEIDHGTTNCSALLQAPLPLVWCYCLSKWHNCSHGICSGLVIWQPRCTEDASSRMRHVVLFPLLCLVIASVTPNGGVSHITLVLSMTHASVPAPVPFPQLSPHVRSYRPIIPSPCALGQQVIAYHPHLIVLYCLVSLSFGS